MSSSGDKRREVPRLLGVGQQAILVFDAESRNDRVGENVEIIEANTCSGDCVYSIRFVGGVKAVIPGVNRRGLYRVGDDHLDDAFLREMLIKNIVWRAGRRTLHGVYEHAVGFTNGEYKHLEGKQVLIPANIPCWSSYRTAHDPRGTITGWSLTRDQVVVTVYKTTPGDRAEDVNGKITADPLVCWKLSDDLIGCVPADLVLELAGTRILLGRELTRVSF